MLLETERIDFYERYYNFPWDEEASYVNYLAQSYFYIRHSTKTLALAAAHLDEEYSVLFKRMVKHISEEMNHEMLCLKDLRSLGRKIEDFEELPETQCLYQTQYYKIQHDNPVGYLGYVYLLESICVNVVPRVIKDKLAPSFDKMALTFLSVHADEDIGHLKSAENVISELNPRDLAAVENNIRFTMKNFDNLLAACK